MKAVVAPVSESTPLMPHRSIPATAPRPVTASTLPLTSSSKVAARKPGRSPGIPGLRQASEWRHCPTTSVCHVPAGRLRNAVSVLLSGASTSFSHSTAVSSHPSAPSAFNRLVTLPVSFMASALAPSRGQSATARYSQRTSYGSGAYRERTGFASIFSGFHELSALLNRTRPRKRPSSV